MEPLKAQISASAAAATPAAPAPAQVPATLLQKPAGAATPRLEQGRATTPSREMGDFAHAYWPPANRPLPGTCFLGMRLWRRRPLSKHNYRSMLADRLKRARRDDTTRQLIDYIEEGEDL